MSGESTEERVARYMAAEDWLEDPDDRFWWFRKSKTFRAQYTASARRVIEIIKEGDRSEQSGSGQRPVG